MENHRNNTDGFNFTKGSNISALTSNDLYKASITLYSGYLVGRIPYTEKHRTIPKYNGRFYIKEIVGNMEKV